MSAASPAPVESGFYVNALGVGFNGMVTIEARKIRRLTGMPLNAWAFLKAMVKHFATPTLEIQFDDQRTVGLTLAAHHQPGPA